MYIKLSKKTNIFKSSILAFFIIYLYIVKFVIKIEKYDDFDDILSVVSF